MIYTCSHCEFTFSRVGKVEDCPDCGRFFVREATKEEMDKFERNYAVLDKEKR